MTANDDTEKFPFKAPDESDIHMFIQWKGTTLCADFDCECGEGFHVDGQFTYYVKCPHCERVYELGMAVIVHAVKHDLPDMSSIVKGF